MEFHALGTKDLYHYDNALNTSSTGPRNLGRGFFTGTVEDNYAFKVPQLYNIKDYTHLFHGSSKQSIRGVINYKILAQSENQNVSPEHLSSKFKPLHLTEKEIEDLIAFLEDGLRDPDLERYVPQEVLSGNCFPNNDPFSVFELGCD